MDLAIILKFAQGLIFLLFGVGIWLVRDFRARIVALEIRIAADSAAHDEAVQTLRRGLAAASEQRETVFGELKEAHAEISKGTLMAAEEKASLVKELYRDFVERDTFIRGFGELKGLSSQIFNEIKEVRQAMDQHIGEGNK